ENDSPNVDIPCIFLALNKKCFVHQENLDTLFKTWPASNFGESDEADLIIANFRRCFYELPPGAWIAHLGMMLSRATDMRRVVVKGLDRIEIPNYLSCINWSWSTDKIAGIIEQISPYVDDVILDMDVGAQMMPTIGLECRIEQQPSQGNRWQKFLEFLVSAGLCTPEKAEALLAWPGVTQKSDVPPEMWPLNLALGDWFAGKDAISCFYRRIYHIKLVYRPDKPLEAKAYLEFGHLWLDARNIPSRMRQLQASDLEHSDNVATPGTNQSYLDKVRHYYNSQTPAILKQFGATYQAGLLKNGSDSITSKANNLICATRAGVKPGMYILDAGCGACGPSIDIATHIPDLKIEALTLSDVQAQEGREFVKKASLCDRINVQVGDYHELSFAEGTFDLVFFLESSGYSYDQIRLFSEAFRVLRPGGILYIKDAFVKEGDLTVIEEEDLAEFNRVYACRPTRMSQTVKSIANCGFRIEGFQDLTEIISTDAAVNAMFADSQNRKVLSEFGRSHFRKSQCITPVMFGEIRATKPPTA
ncbi:MAG: methyltransferase domain-containing protein, partial [Cyanobacteria bacterium P01_H01_bin.15]